MTAWEPTTGDGWGGRPVARRIADAAPRRRMVVTGTIMTAEVSRWRGLPAYVCRLEDDSGSINVVFGRPTPVPGIMKGALCTVEGTVQSNGGSLLLWDPFYRFEP